MTSVIIFDSAYGNTARVAAAIGRSLEAAGEVRLLLAGETTAHDIAAADLLIVGSPTQGGRPTKAIDNLLDALPDNALAGKHVAAFDTRFAPAEHGLGLRLLMKTIGFAAEKIAILLEALGGIPVLEPAGFIVQDKEGPLAAGELERAMVWASSAIVHRPSVGAPHR